MWGKPLGSLTWFSSLKPLCRCTFIQYSCLASSAVFHIPIKQRNCVSFSQIYSRYLTAAWKSANSPISPGDTFQTGLCWMHKSSHPQNIAGGRWGRLGACRDFPGDFQKSNRAWMYFIKTQTATFAFAKRVSRHWGSTARPCPDCPPAVFPHGTLDNEISVI